MKRILTGLAGLLIALTALTPPARADLQLLMFEQAGCAYCIMWDREIGPIYPLTPEAGLAPLRKVDLRAKLPADLTIRSKPVFTPTFILVRDGVEVSRLEGYPGEDFFWGLLGKMLQQQPEWEAAAAEG
ncbi:hypothetical protein [Actibacterium sp. D379-3]